MGIPIPGEECTAVLAFRLALLRVEYYVDYSRQLPVWRRFRSEHGHPLPGSLRLTDAQHSGADVQTQQSTLQIRITSSSGAILECAEVPASTS